MLNHEIRHINGKEFYYNKKLSNFQISSIIHIVYRLFTLRMLIENDILSKYDIFILNRSDLLHTTEISINKYIKQLKSNVILPNGEHYGGLPDRFAIIPKCYIHKWLNLYKYYFNPLFLSPEKITNINSITKKIPIYYIPYSFYCVRNNYDSSRWSKGSHCDDNGIIIKYWSEYEKCMEIKEKNNKDRC